MNSQGAHSLSHLWESPSDCLPLSYPHPLSLKAYFLERVSDESFLKDSFLSWVTVRGNCMVAVLGSGNLLHLKIQAEETWHSYGRVRKRHGWNLQWLNISAWSWSKSLLLRFHRLMQVIGSHLMLVICRSIPPFQGNTASHGTKVGNVEFSYQKTEWRIMSNNITWHHLHIRMAP